MKHIVITGVSRGIGLKLAELSLERGDKVWGIARDPSGTEEIKKLFTKFQDRLVLYKGDVNNEELGKKFLKDSGASHIDILINNAGIYKDDDRKGFETTFLTNSIAPYFLTKDLLPLLKKSREPKAAFISSMMGSIADNASGGSVSYRASKAALNMIVKCLSIDEPWLTSLLFHPGWVKTRMGGENAPTEADDSAEGLISLIHSSTKNDSGSFRNFKGNSLPW